MPNHVFCSVAQWEHWYYSDKSQVNNALCNLNRSPSSTAHAEQYLQWLSWKASQLKWLHIKDRTHQRNTTPLEFLSWFSNIISLITPYSCLEIQSNSFLIILIQMLALSLKGHLAFWKPSGMPFTLVCSHCLGELIAYYTKQRAMLWSRIKQLKSNDHNDLQFRECIVNVLQMDLCLHWGHCTVII